MNNIDNRIAELEAKIEVMSSNFNEIKEALYQLLNPPETDAVRYLELTELAKQISSGNRNALKAWNRRQEPKMKLIGLVKGAGR